MLLFMAVHVGLGNIPQLQCVLLALYVCLWVFVWFGTGIKSPSANDHFRHNNTEQARAVNRWPVGSFDEHLFDDLPLRHRACWQKSRPSAFAPDACDPLAPPASDT